MFTYKMKIMLKSWNKPVQSNEGKVSCSRKKQEPLMVLKLMT